MTNIKIYEKISRYFLGVWFLMCSIDGWVFIFFGIHSMGTEPYGSYLPALMHTTYFWVFLKIIQSIGTISLLANYKPALGLALIIPIIAVLCLFYMIEWKTYFIPISLLIMLATLILIRAYSKSYRHLLEDYP